MSAHRILPAGRTARRAACVAITAFLAGNVPAGAASSWRARPAMARNVMFGYAAEPLAADALRPLERAFLEKTSELSREQLQLAQLAVSQAAGADVRSYAQQLVEDHRQINSAVDSLRRKKGTLLERKPAEIVSDTYQRLAQTAGGDFDREFVRMAAEREARTLTLFEQVIGDATDADIRELVGTYLPMLREHKNRGTELKKTFE